jgi:hypothetical protein
VTRWLVAAIAGLVLVASGSPADAGPGGKKKKKPPPVEPVVVTPEPPPPPAPEAPLGEAPPAANDPRLIVGILDIRVDGMPAAMGDEFERQLEQLAAGTTKDRFWIGTRRRLREMLARSTKWMEGCLLGPCMLELRKQTRAAVVLTVFLQNLGSTYRYVLTVIRTDSGAVVDQRTEACGACTQAEAVTAATIAALDAITGVPDKVVQNVLEDPKTITLRAEAPYKRRLSKAKRRTRTTALILTGLAAIGGGLGGYWLAKDKDDRARPTLGVAAGLATAGMLSFAVSLTWD